MNNNTLNQLNQFMRSFQGDPKAEVMKRIQSSGMNQQQLNQLQEQANQLYLMAKNAGIVK